MNGKEHIEHTIKRVIISGGGTGGHIFPAIAIAQALKKNDPLISILFVGAKGKMEMERVPKEGFDIIGLDIAGLNRQSILKNILLPYKLVKSFFQVRKIFKQFKPDAVVGVGGYASFPVVRFAQSKRIASFIHESNSFAGKSNILLGKQATKIFVASEGMEQFFPAEKIIITGNPIRENISNANITKEEAVKFFGLDASMQTVLVMGGSLGAKSINCAIADRLDDFNTHQLQLIWQTGKSTAGEFLQKAEGKKNIWVNEFIGKMEMAYAAADIVVSRAGAMSVAELCVSGKPAIFVPYPLAAEDHQTANAVHAVEAGMALMITEKNIEKLNACVFDLLNDSSKLQAMKEALARADAHNHWEEILKEVLGLAQKEGVKK